MWRRISSRRGGISLPLLTKGISRLALCRPIRIEWVYLFNCSNTCRGRPGSVRFANGPGDVSGGSTTFLAVHGRRRRRMTTTVRKVRSGMKLGIKQALTAVAAFGFVTTGAASASAGDHVVSSAFGLASKLDFSVGFDCSNHPGPSITLGGGTIKLGAI